MLLHLIDIQHFPFRCTIADSAVYSAVATNSQGKATSKTTICVRSKIFFPSLSLLTSCPYFTFLVSPLLLPTGLLLFNAGASGAAESSYLPGQGEKLWLTPSSKEPS